MSGAEIYDSVTRLDDPTAGVRSLKKKRLQKLTRHVDGLPDSGIPFLVSALVMDELGRRYLGAQNDQLIRRNETKSGESNE